MNLNKVPLNKANLMRVVEDVEIYSFYTGQEIKVQSAINSPLMEDKKPSFGYFIGDSGEICWRDFRIGSGDCIEFVKQLFSLNFNEALIKIAKDFKIEEEFEFKDSEVPTTNNKRFKLDREEITKKLSENKKIDIKKRKAELYDIQFWIQFGITKDILIKYNVTPIEYYFINGHIIKTDKYAYAFIEYKDSIPTYKIYQPFNPDYKWINSHDESVWQGWEQLPEKGSTLIITKSLKDVMSIDSVIKIPSVALQSESVLPKSKIVLELYQRFETIFIFYDNDFDKEINWGEEYGKKLSQQFGFYFIQIRDKWKSKDFSDLIKNHGAVKARSIWDEEICIPY